ncbi:hypothetical protein C8Q79DRAFT_555655 [Trametes meyenii]|nr:hypothetical protein C8Q79DRAFT_555655 [Trametes meyenii]
MTAETTGVIEGLAWNDALSLSPTRDRLWLITSPNMEYVPAPSLGLKEVVLRDDYRYGEVDPIQWPQLYSEGYEFLCAIPRPLPGTHRLGPLWWTPNQAEDFELLSGSIVKCLGLLKQHCLDPLSNLVDQLSERVRILLDKRSDVVEERLVQLEVAMRNARDRLRIFPCTFRDVLLQVRMVQRHWLMASAFLDYYGVYIRLGTRKNRVNRGLMGAFTTDPGVAQNLFELGIPVWWLRQEATITEDTRIIAQERLTNPTDICLTVRGSSGSVIYRGLVGKKHLDAILHVGHTYRDVARVPLLQIDGSGGYASAMSQREYKDAFSGPSSNPSRQRREEHETAPSPPSAGRVLRAPEIEGRRPRAGHPYVPTVKNAVRGVGTPPKRQKHCPGIEKFADIDHEWMPDPLPAWRRAMNEVAARSVNNGQQHFWGYWIPEPGLFVRTKTPDRASRYFMTWLRLRPGWLYLLRERHGELSPISPQWWRDVLYGETGRKVNENTLNGQRTRQCMLVFGQVFQTEDLDLSPTAPPTWFGRRLEQFDPTLCRAIVWEVCELGFRHELLALDRLLVPNRLNPDAEFQRDELIGRVFAGHDAYCVAKLPEDTNVGLAARLPHSRVPYLEAFRRVLARWPRCPPFIFSAPPIAYNMRADDIEERERGLVAYYVRTFYEESGRAPIVPRSYPVPTQHQAGPR